MKKLLRVVLWVVCIIAVLLALCWWLARPPSAGPFFEAADAPEGAPGTLLRSEPFTREVPTNAMAWRILYTTRNADGSAALASAIVMVPKTSATAPRPVVAWTHGTTGVVPGCGPSQLQHPFANVPAVAQLLERGWAMVATDYTGQGTRGPNPYLIGAGQAYSALDSVRAARQLQGVALAEQVVIWGHSQGGNASLWTAALAPEYAPDVAIAGIAAVAPASDLPALIVPIQHTLVGRIMSGYILRAYAGNYSDVQPAAYVRGWRRVLAHDMASRCLEGRKALFSVAEAAIAGGTLFSTSPVEGALGARLAENTPTRSIAAPVMIAQGLADDLVLPEVQTGYVQARCAAGQVIELHQYAGQDHLSIVAPDSPLNEQLLSWTEQRFRSAPAPASCAIASH